MIFCCCWWWLFLCFNQAFMNLYFVSAKGLVKSFLFEVHFKKHCYGSLGNLENIIIAAPWAYCRVRVHLQKPSGCCA